MFSQQQYLGQGKEDQHQGYAGAGAYIVAHAGNDALRHAEAHKEPRADHHKSRGDHRGEGQVQRFDDRGFLIHGLPQLPIAGGDHYGIVDIGAHLDRAHDQVAQEKDIVPFHGGDGEVDPDAALDHQDQQQRHPKGFEGEKQDQHHQRKAHKPHDGVIGSKRVPETHGADRIAGEHDAALVILPRDPMDPLQEEEGLL